jgi:hypothetical protein
LKIAVFLLLCVPALFAATPTPALINQPAKSWVRQYRKPNLAAVVHAYENGFDWDWQNHVGMVFSGHLGTYGTQSESDLYGIFHTNQTWLYSHASGAFAPTNPMDRPCKRCGAKTYYCQYAGRFVIYGGRFGGHTDNGYYEVGTDGKTLTKEIDRDLNHAQNPWAFDARTGQWYEMRPLMEGPDDGNGLEGYGSNWVYIKEYGAGMLLPPLGSRVYIYSVHSNAWSLIQASAAAEIVPKTSNLPCAYDLKHRKVVVLNGSNTHTYDFHTRVWQRISATPAPSLGSESWYHGYSTMEYDINSGRTVFLSHNGTETWSFNLGTQAWTRETTAGNPPNSGSMGEGLTYDPLNHVTLLYSNRYDEIWTYRQAAVDTARVGEAGNVRAAVTETAVNITWDPPSFGQAPDRYYVYRAAWSDHLAAGQGLEPGPYVLIDSVSGTAYTDAPSKTAKTFYSYSVQPARGAARGIMSSPAFSNRPVPMGLLVTPFSRTRVGLKWVADTAADVTGYNVYRKYGAIPAHHELQKLNTSPVGPKPVFMDSTVNIIGDTIVTYVVTTVNRYGQESGLSPRADTRLARVRGFWADTAALTMHWFPALADTFQEYQIWSQQLVCRDCGAASFAKVPYPAFRDTFQVFSLPMANQYHLKVRAVNAIGQIGFFSDLLPLASRNDDLAGMFRGDGMFRQPSYDPFWDLAGLAPGEIGVENHGHTDYRQDAVLDIHIYPNPVKRLVKINYELQIMNYEFKDIHLAIYDVNGRCVADFSQKIHDSSFIICNSITWNPSGLPSGIYILRLEAANRSVSRKLVLQR